MAPTQPPTGDSGAVAEAARWLVEAENPVIVVDLMAHDQEGIERLVALAEALQAPVVNQFGRMNFPNMHYLSQSAGAIAQADVILGLELYDTWGTINTLRDRVHRDEQRRARPDARVIDIGVKDLFTKSNYQSFQRYFRSGSVHRGRRAGDAARADGSGVVGNDESPTQYQRRARAALARSARADAGSESERSSLRVEREPGIDGASLRGTLAGREGSRLGQGFGRRHAERLGSKALAHGQALPLHRSLPVARVWGMVRRRRLAQRSRTGTPADSRSIFSATAT